MNLDVDRDGAEIVAGVVSPAEVAALVAALPSNVAGLRNLLQRVPLVAQLATSPALVTLLSARGYHGMRPVRALFFDKNRAKNWKVPWHQDVAIAVRERRDVPGFGSWSVKDGAPHVEPPASVMERIVTLRVHLDDCPAENGALRVLPGSHQAGILSRDEIAAWTQRPAVICAVPAGGVMLMKPLVLHASSPSAVPAHRRVVHLEFSAENLPGGLEWWEAVAATRAS